jgi:hypothetical protein
MKDTIKNVVIAMLLMSGVLYAASSIREPYWVALQTCGGKILPGTKATVYLKVGKQISGIIKDYSMADLQLSVGQGENSSMVIIPLCNIVYVKNEVY